MTPDAPRAPRPPRPQITLEVLRREQLAPHLVRVHLGGEELAGFADNGFADRYVKLWFAKPGLGLEPPYDPVALRERLAPEDLPVTRTYTVRELDLDAGRLAIDFVVHGDEGLAGPWADRAAPGQRLTMSGPGGAYSPDPEADWHLLAGDESALPAIAAALEAMDPAARGLAFVEVDGAADEIPLRRPEGVELRWLHRAPERPGASAVLVDAVADADWLEGRVHAFVHGERETMKRLRDVLFAQRGLERTQVSLSGYWAMGRTEDRFQAEKREPIGRILS
ncbi:siderophore-interacting protein [Homoserinibacter sp. YIM 151385]|uniref:siderophore-interacting protein n=1 Tax=Homoserinibacter sp. YIM 151385 TaxID=2985506 RepID=UPI0022F0FFC0|nr:siderophore-interacting protein [Homoserinibacter sp. YIM 151385]WBU38788.1 siderophore-interacting protein [Homoserinibacter sp. YIM 151385]